MKSKKIQKTLLAAAVWLLSCAVANLGQTGNAQPPIEISVDAGGRISVACGAIKLRAGAPVVDGKVYGSAAARVAAENANRRIVSYDLGADVGRFVVTIERNAANEPTIQYRVENVPASRNFYNFGLRFETVTGIERYYRSGYHSWDGSLYVQPENAQVLSANEKRWEKGYAVSQIVPPGDQAALTFGFERHDRFQQTFTYSKNLPPSLEILTLWDLKTIDAQKREAGGEVLRFFADNDYENGLRRWARAIAERSPTKPRLGKTPINGWNSWYDQYAFITEKSVLEYLDGVKKTVDREKLPMRVFQLDNGFTNQTGDWLDVNAGKFPRGIKFLMDEIRRRDFTPGIWIAPFMVGNKSELYKKHPDWVLRDIKTGEPKALWKFYGEYRWHELSEEYYTLDATNPAAFEYIRNLMRAYRRDFGADYFKTDFMHYGSEFGPDEVRYFQTGATRIEIWRKVAEMIRQEIGEDSIWLGCGAPLFAGIGLFDANRISGDIGIEWASTGPSAEAVLRDLPARNFLNNILYQIDPDSILLREKYHRLTGAEVRALALFGAMSGGVLTTSDNLAVAPPERVELWKMMLSTKKQTARYPFMGRSEIRYAETPGAAWGEVRHEAEGSPVIVQVRDSSDGKSQIVHVFNISRRKVQRTLTFKDLGIGGKRYVYDWTNKKTSDASTDELIFDVDAHDSKLFFLSSRPLAAAPQTLALE